MCIRDRPWPAAVASGLDYYLVWPRTRPGGERLRRLSDFLQGEARAMQLPDVEMLRINAANSGE